MPEVASHDDTSEEFCFSGSALLSEGRLSGRDARLDSAAEETMRDSPPDSGTDVRAEEKTGSWKAGKLQADAAIPTAAAINILIKSVGIFPINFFIFQPLKTEDT